jgi:drug/metabolite transporter (DMT)-like permease
MSSAAQMLCGAVGLSIAGMLGGEIERVDLAAISLRSWLALAYLTFIGALVGFCAYVYLLRHTTMAKVSTYAFVNPVVAVALGWLLVGEPVTVLTLLAGVLIVTAVGMILFAKPAGR